MLIGMRDTGTENFDNVQAKSILVTRSLGPEVFGTVEGPLDSKVIAALLEGRTLDLEFGIAADEDADVVTLSGVVMTFEEFGAGDGHEEPNRVVGFVATACVFED